jgi:hypothetical protein
MSDTKTSNTSTKIEELVKDGVKEITIRQGTALPPEEERIKLNKSGNIKAPANYFTVMKETIDPLKAMVVFSRSEMEINLLEDPRQKYAGKVKGTLLLNPELLAFGIDSNTIYSPKELSDFLKRNAHHFINRTENATLVTGLRNFNAKVNSIIEQSGDQRGNIRSLIDRKVESGLPEKFALKMPIFLGYDVQEFNVDICIDAKNTTIEIWLESPELNELIKTQRDGIMNAELDKIEGLVKIEK